MAADDDPVYERAATRGAGPDAVGKPPGPRHRPPAGQRSLSAIFRRTGVLRYPVTVAKSRGRPPYGARQRRSARRRRCAL